MEILKSIRELLKGGSHAGRTEKRVVGGNGRERRILHSVPSVRERIVSDIRGIRMLASACADERSRDTGEMPSDPIRRESRALIAAAKRVGRFVDATAIPGSRYTIRTGESEVRMVQSEQVYLRFIDPIIGFKQPLLGILSAALESDSAVDALLSSIYSITLQERES